MPQNNVLLIFIKNLEKGKVKTRLAKTLGDEQALEVYKKLTAYTRKIAVATQADRQVWYSRFIAENDKWPPENFEKKLQQGDNLGMRMQHAFAKAFTEGYKKVVIIGSDCAQLTVPILEEAYARLDDHDVVIGPSEDGGYYLLGMSACHQELFEGIAWSTHHVLPDTLQIAQKNELQVQLLRQLNDVDNAEDWKSSKGLL